MPSAPSNAIPISLNSTRELSRIQSEAFELLQSAIALQDDSGWKEAFPQFIGLSEKDIRVLFDDYRLELEYHSILILLATIEAVLRQDYKHKRRKTKHFRSLYATYGNRTSLEAIVEAWKIEKPSQKDVFGNYKDALRLRNWLAHGRYFLHRAGRHNYSIDYIYELGIQIQNILD